MKKWQAIKKITLSILIFIVVFAIIYSSTLALSIKSYPYLSLGMNLTNGYEVFKFNAVFILYISFWPIFIDAIILIISSLKLKKWE